MRCFLFNSEPFGRPRSGNSGDQLALQKQQESGKSSALLFCSEYNRFNQILTYLLLALYSVQGARYPERCYASARHRRYGLSSQ